jgi:hypothetical protein
MSLTHNQSTTSNYFMYLNEKDFKYALYVTALIEGKHFYDFIL